MCSKLTIGSSLTELISFITDKERKGANQFDNCDGMIIINCRSYLPPFFSIWWCLCRISVTFVDKDGEEKDIKVPVGMSMLEAAQENDIELEGKDYNAIF